MKLVRADGLLSQLDEFITTCCISGDFQPEPAIQYMSGSLGYITLNEDNPYPPILQSLQELFDSVGVTVTEDTTEPKSRTLDERASAYIEKVRAHLSELREKKQQLDAKCSRLEQDKAQYSHFVSLDTPLEAIIASEYIKIRFGFLPGESYEKLMVAYADNPYIFFVPCSAENGGYWGLYFTPVRAAEEIDGIFSMLYFERMKLPSATGTPAQIVSQLEEQIREVKEESARLDEAIAAYWAQHEQTCSRIYSQLKWLEATFALRHYAAYRDKYFFYVGWIAESAVEEFEQRVHRIPKMKLTINDPGKQDKAAPPTRLRNLLPFRPFEFFVDMYGLPSYGEIDITAFVAVTFTVLFGLMFGDLGQGAVLAIGGFVLYKWKKMALAKLIVPCGLSSMVFGFVFGSVFGFEHALDPLYHALGWEGKPIEVMDSINTVLLLAIGIGVALVMAAIVLNILGAVRKKHWGEAIFSNNGLVGLAVYFAGVNLASGFMKGPQLLPTAAAGAIVGVGLAVLFFKEILIGIVDHHPDWKPESWLDYVLQNIFEVLEYVLSYFSNTVSFLRVGAFVIVHAAMMMVVFSLAGSPANPIVVVLGNALVIALEGLLSGIQGLRLEFYEIFSRCYEGGGRPFRGVQLAPVRQEQPQK